MQSIPAAQAAMGYALDSELFCRDFFPKTVRQKSAPFHRDIWDVLDNSNHRQIAFEVFRDGAKTSLLRLFAAKRIAYGYSRTIMIVSASQAHSIRTVRWLRRAIEYNRLFAQFYGLKKGAKWTDDELEIHHTILGFTITIIAVGITGQTRGINIDDYRPDLIIVDDVDDEETTSTLEQRLKTEERFFGAILNSLTPASENPEAKIVVLQTSLHKEDLINKIHSDPTWETKKISIFNEHGESAWPQRYPTEEVIAQKQAFISRGQILLWLREKECTIGDEETADFKRDWLLFWDILPEKLIIIISCDPAPPPSELQIKKGLRKKDEEVWSVQGLHHGNRYLIEQVASKDHDPEWSATTFFALCQKWKPLKVVIETVAYQRTLKAFLEREMRIRKQYYLIESYPPSHRTKDQRKKRHRIMHAFSGIASQGAFFVHPSQQTFISQFAAYPNVDHDDRLDACAMGLDALGDIADAEDYDDLYSEEEAQQEIPWNRSAP